MDEKQQRLRATFDEVAERYQRVRPTYPDALFVDLAAAVGGLAGRRILEIGPGTGQATRVLADRGARVTAIEIGPALAAVARRELTAHPQVEVVTAAFEEWLLPAEPFDVVFAATAWHWLDPSIRVEKAAEAMQPGGVLALVDTHHIAGGSETFFVAVQECYERWDPATPPGLRLETADQIEPADDGVAASGRFEPAMVRRYEWEMTYSTGDYRELLLTYSGHLALEPAAQNGLLDCIGQLMDERSGGRITKRYMNELRVARRR